MHPVNKIVTPTDWITVLLVLLLVGIFILKALNSHKLKGYFSALFNKGFIEDEIEENTILSKTYYAINFMFCSGVLSLGIYHHLNAYGIINSRGFYLYIFIFSAVLSYLLLKRLIDALLSRLFLVQKEVQFFRVSKFSYLYAISFYLFIFLILVQYTQLNLVFLSYTMLFFFLIRFGIHVANNKKLIFSKLFYFILYICALEIAPLFILFKLMF